MEQFIRERNEALSSLDETRIRDYYRKWSGLEMPMHPTVFWGGVHKAITAITSLPMELRNQSKKWLNDHQMKSWDDGEL